MNTRAVAHHHDPEGQPHEPFGPEHPSRRLFRDETFMAKIDALITEVGGDTESFDGRMIRDLLTTSLKLVGDGRDTGELKLLANSLKEMRYAYRVFAQYPDAKKISIFGSARTSPDHTDYKSAVDFSRLMGQRGWEAITGAGDGIMKAGHEGPGRESSFGLAIRLPFETSANTIIDGDSKLINFRYFFTRKLMFVSQADAVAVFPGGFGTADEAFEVLTLIQTGKAAMMPIVLVEGEGNGYWEVWERYVKDACLKGGFISAEDLNLFHIAHTAVEAADYVERFYRNYHSSRYIKDDLIIRMNYRISDADVKMLSKEFAVLLKSGEIVQQDARPEEKIHLELPRLVFTHTQHKFGLVRKLIDRINDCDPA